jgi:hypothetical protein
MDECSRHCRFNSKAISLQSYVGGCLYIRYDRVPLAASLRSPTLSVSFAQSVTCHASLCPMSVCRAEWHKINYLQPDFYRAASVRVFHLRRTLNIYRAPVHYATGEAQRTQQLPACREASDQHRAPMYISLIHIHIDFKL